MIAWHDGRYGNVQRFRMVCDWVREKNHNLFGSRNFEICSIEAKLFPCDYEYQYGGYKKKG